MKGDLSDVAIKWGAMKKPPLLVNKRAVRILLECFLV